MSLSITESFIRLYPHKVFEPQPKSSDFSKCILFVTSFDISALLSLFKIIESYLLGYLLLKYSTIAEPPPPRPIIFTFFSNSSLDKLSNSTFAHRKS